MWVTKESDWRPEEWLSEVGKVNRENTEKQEVDQSTPAG